MAHQTHDLSRRRFLLTSATAAAGLTLASGSIMGAPSILRSYGKPDSMINGVQVGVITYSYRGLPDQSADATLKYVVDSGISAIELMGDPAENFAGKPENPVDFWSMLPLWRKAREGEELTEDEQKELADARAQMEAYGREVAEWRAKVSMDDFKKVRKMYEAAGVRIYGFKPNAFGENNTDAEIDFGFRAAKALGANQVTLEFTDNLEHTQKLGDFGKKYKIYIGYHGHEQQTPTLWDEALKQSKYNAMNLDLGHYVAAGNPDPLELIRTRHDRIASMHVKDRQKPENGKGNLQFGEGDTPIIPALQLMRDQKYAFPATLELEYRIPDGSDAVTEVRKCLDFCRMALES